MTPFTQKNRPLAVTTPLGSDTLLLVGFSGQETISQSYRYQLDLVAPVSADIPFEKLLGQPVGVRLALPGGKNRYFHGVCKRMSQGKRDAHFYSYRMEIVPRFWLLTKRAQSRIFQHLAVPDILKKVLAGLNVSYELLGTFHPRNFCVQYRETDFAFASRLMEEEGIYYFFKHGADGHQMVVGNTPQSHSSMAEQGKILFEEVAGGRREDMRITEWEKTQEVRTAKHVLWDHCFELPGKRFEAARSLPSTLQVGKVTHFLTAGSDASLEVYDYPGEFAKRFDGVDAGGGDRADYLQRLFEDNARTVALRNQEEAAAALVISGASNCRHLVAGHKFTLERHGNADGDYLVTSVTHAIQCAVDFRSEAPAAVDYANRFTCIPLALPFRPPRGTPKPTVEGTQTATVVGPAGSEIFTDKYGRIKVQFHWDREGRRNADSSCWVRVSQPNAGKGWGSFVVPRVGQEVIVDFLEGDPDRPIVIGSVYNADQVPHYCSQGKMDPEQQHNPALSGIKSCTTPGGQGFNELRFHDGKGKEQVFIHAQRDMDVRVKNDSRQHVESDMHLTVGPEGPDGSGGGGESGSGSDTQADGDYRLWVHNDQHVHVLHNHVEKVEGNFQFLVGGGVSGGNQDIVIKGTKKERIDGDSHLHVKKELREKIDGDRDMIVGQDCRTSVGKNYLLSVKGYAEEKVQDKRFDAEDSYSICARGLIGITSFDELIVRVSKNIKITCDGELVLQNNNGFIKLGPEGLTIEGRPKVEINCGNPEPGVYAYQFSRVVEEPRQPLDAAEAKPLDPAPAGSGKSGSSSAPPDNSGAGNVF